MNGRGVQSQSAGDGYTAMFPAVMNVLRPDRPYLIPGQFGLTMRFPSRPILLCGVVNPSRFAAIAYHTSGYPSLSGQLPVGHYPEGMNDFFRKVDLVVRDEAWNLAWGDDPGTVS